MHTHPLLAMVVSSIDVNGPAAQCGTQIDIGDEVVSVNGIALEGMTVIEAERTLETCGAVAQIQLRPREEKKSELSS